MIECPNRQAPRRRHLTHRRGSPRVDLSPPPSAEAAQWLALSVRNDAAAWARSARFPIRSTALSACLAAACAQTLFSGPPISSGTSGWSRVPGLTNDMFVVLATGGILLILLLVWARFLRKKPHAHPSSAQSSAPEFAEGEGGQPSHAHHHRHRRRRRRREHRSRNPTLAETGGLPPPRSESQAPPAA